MATWDYFPIPFSAFGILLFWPELQREGPASARTLESAAGPDRSGANLGASASQPPPPRQPSSRTVSTASDLAPVCTSCSQNLLANPSRNAKHRTAAAPFSTADPLASAYPYCIPEQNPTVTHLKMHAIGPRYADTQAQISCTKGLTHRGAGSTPVHASVGQEFTVGAFRREPTLAQRSNTRGSRHSSTGCRIYIDKCGTPDGAYTERPIYRGKQS
jgi:hypothetical protein